MDEEVVFRALADASRRRLLDLLFERDGLTLSQLSAHLPMTRFGCMKHLQILEEAGLISVRKVGREKHHYLNPVPIQQVYERWVDKYARRWASGLTGLKHALEEQAVTTRPQHVFEIYIQTSPERLWQALTDGAFTRDYYFGTRVESSWEPGAAYRYLDPAGAEMISGEVLAAEPPRRLVTSFRPLWMPEAAAAPPSTVTYEIEPIGDACRLRLIHADLAYAAEQVEGMNSGWVRILSGLKTLLETGAPLALAG